VRIKSNLLSCFTSHGGVDSRDNTSIQVPLTKWDQDSVDEALKSSSTFKEQSHNTYTVDKGVQVSEWFLIGQWGFNQLQGCGEPATTVSTYGGGRLEEAMASLTRPLSDNVSVVLGALASSLATLSIRRLPHTS
jgi:hypothetical protein